MTLTDLRKAYEAKEGVIIMDAVATVASVMVNCDTPPTEFPGGWVKKMLSHQPMGQVDVASLKLYQSEEQRTGGTIRVDKLSERLQEKKPGNVCMAIHLYRNPHLIPEEWKQYYGVVFTGSTLLADDGFSYVPCLYWGVGAWYFGGFRLDRELDAGSRAVCSGE
ncbi:TPA: hypothetical protein DEP96_03875 [Candidatus Uhrbacteria bacterium]|nr:hypothetical protein [Candidatus Uhrbacteria bacterium]